jgi:multiple antibiotic resistance protein
MPMIAGPGTMSLLITHNQEGDGLNSMLIISGAIVLSTICIYLILKSSFYIVKILGASGINALSRIIGFIVIAIGVEFIISAVVSVFNIA